MERKKQIEEVISKIDHKNNDKMLYHHEEAWKTKGKLIEEGIAEESDGLISLLYSGRINGFTLGDYQLIYNDGKEKENS